MFRYMNSTEYQKYVKQQMAEKALFNSGKSCEPCDKMEHTLHPHAHISTGKYEKITKMLCMDTYV